MRKFFKRIGIVILSVIALAFICFLGIYASFYPMRSPPNKMEGRDLAYYNIIASSKDHEIDLKLVFDFEWDQAFVQADANEKPEDLNAKLGFDANLSVLGRV